MSFNKKIYTLAINIISLTFIFWLIYTIVFLFIDGWHYEAISPTEKQLDLLTDISFKIGWFFYLISVINLIHKIFREL